MNIRKWTLGKRLSRLRRIQCQRKLLQGVRSHAADQTQTLIRKEAIHRIFHPRVQDQEAKEIMFHMCPNQSRIKRILPLIGTQYLGISALQIVNKINLS